MRDTLPVLPVSTRCKLFCSILVNLAVQEILPVALSGTFNTSDLVPYDISATSQLRWDSSHVPAFSVSASLVSYLTRP